MRKEQSVKCVEAGSILKLPTGDIVVGPGTIPVTGTVTGEKLIKMLQQAAEKEIFPQIDEY